MACPNDRDCREMFGTVSEARERIRNFRKKYWNGKNDPGNIFDRRKQLFVDIDAIKVYNKETKQFIIEYKIEGRFVCKSFFHVSASKYYWIACLIISFVYSACVGHKCTDVS